MKAAEELERRLSSLDRPVRQRLTKSRLGGVSG